MVLFHEVGGVPGRGVEARRAGRELEEVPHANREVRRVDERAPSPPEGFHDAGQVLAPSRRAADDAGAAGGQGQEVLDRRGGRRELEDDVGGGQPLRGETRPAGILLRPEPPDHGVATRRRSGLDLAAHLASPDDPDAHT